MRVRHTVAAALCSAVALGASPASAQVFGTFTWQMQPYCNRVTLTLTTSPAGFTLAGSDDQCGAATKASASGVGVFNLDGTVGINFAIVTSPSGEAVHVSGVVSPANGQGTWADDTGNSGIFAFFGAVPGLPPRPAAMAPLAVADNPATPSNPCVLPVKPTLILCGNTTLRWLNGASFIGGLQVWKDPQGQVHIRGAVRRNTGGLTPDSMFFLPPGFRPRRMLAFAVATHDGVGAAGTGVLRIFPDDQSAFAGNVDIMGTEPTHTSAFLGEIVFSVDR
jgi:hypothetical protein